VKFVDAPSSLSTKCHRLHKKYLKCDPFTATTWEQDKVQNEVALFLPKTPYLGPRTKFPA